MSASGEILINGRFLGRRPTGVDRFAHELLRALDELIGLAPAGTTPPRFRLLVPSGVRTEFRHIPSEQVGQRQGFAWEQIDLPQAARGRPLLSLCNAAPLFKRAQIVTIHDAAPARVPESYGFRFRLWYRLLMPWLGRLSRRVLTVSEFSRQEIAAAYGIPGNKIRVLPESGEHMLRVTADTAILDRLGLHARPFVLAVSSMVPHKDFATLVRAAEQLGDQAGFDVVIAGGTDPRIFAGASLPESVRHAGYVSDGELRALYEHAACFVFPSYYEGFGLPLTEAMVLGCPVIAARAASIPEVCGDAARYFEPGNDRELAALLETSLADTAWQQAAREAGKLRSERWRWSLAARALLEALP